MFFGAERERFVSENSLGVPSSRMMSVRERCAFVSGGGCHESL
jgi:hypothetical protein